MTVGQFNSESAGEGLAYRSFRRCLAVVRAGRPIGAGDHANWLIFSNATSLCASWVVTSAFGVVYWLVAARTFPLATVGLASGLIAAMLLVGNISSLGFGSFVVGELRRHKADAPSLILVAFTAALAIGVTLGGAVGVVAGRLVTHLRVLESPWHLLLFAVGVGLTAASIVFDQALMGLLRGTVQLRRNVLFAAAKLALLVVTAVLLNSHTSIALFGTWVLALAVSLAVVGLPLCARLRLSTFIRTRRTMLAGVGRLAGAHQLFNLALKVPLMFLPVLVPALLSPSINASFYIATTIAGLLYQVPGSLATALYAAASSHPRTFAAKLHFSLRTSLGLTSVACAITILLAPLILGVFGPSYAAHGTAVLRIFALAAVPMVVKVHYSTIRRVAGGVARATWSVSLGALLEVALALVGAKVDGVVGLSLGWALALCIEAAAMMRVVGPALGHPLSLMASAVRGPRIHPTADKAGVK